jgi:hypothetical protein
MRLGKSARCGFRGEVLSHGEREGVWREYLRRASCGLEYLREVACSTAAVGHCRWELVETRPDVANGLGGGGPFFCRAECAMLFARKTRQYIAIECGGFKQITIAVDWHRKEKELT